MHYYRSSELAELYGVSRRTVTNWVKKAREGKLDLKLLEKSNEFYILKTKDNESTIQKITKERRKYLNKRSHQVITPSDEFYNLFNDAQVYDIIQNLSLNRELPLQYTYFGIGARHWSDFRESFELMDAERLLNASMSYIDWLLEGYKKVNIVDVGVGNGGAAKPLIARLLEMGKMKRYIGIDLSPDMLDITTRNIGNWFDNQVPVETHIKDISRESFGDLIAESPNQVTHEQDTINLVLLLGGHISNFQYPAEVLRMVHKSMGSKDILISNFKLGTPMVKTRLSFITSYQERVKMLLDLIGIDESLYTVEIGYSEEQNIRYSRIIFRRMITVEFQLPKGSWFVDLNKDESVLTFRAHFNDPFEFPAHVFFRNGFNVLMTTQRIDHEGMLLVADLNT